MPTAIDGPWSSKKGKRLEEGNDKGDGKASKSQIRIAKASHSDDAQARILLLETQILDSRRHYNGIADLIAEFGTQARRDGTAIIAAISLCRVFSRLIAAGNMNNPKGGPDDELLVIQWLKERHKEYMEELFVMLAEGSVPEQQTALTLIMRMIKNAPRHLINTHSKTTSPASFTRLCLVLLETADADEIRQEFVEKYVERYDDVRFYTFSRIVELASLDRSPGAGTGFSSHILYILSSIEKIPSEQDLDSFYFEPPTKSKHPLHSLMAHKKQAQEAWLALLRMGLSKEQRKTVLSLTSNRIAPWFVKAELLMDFLTDSYNTGGSTSLLALSGLFYLMQQKNLDYPLFYHKLYSLLGSDLLHSRHRSRFFRLLDTFLASTHLPAALVASFIKRLSRLALHAPPAGIVAVIPWVYNLLKRHPTCTFMVHRESRGEMETTREGMEDPFDMTKEDPMATHAIESSLWEIETLQSHYHPNVATLARVISEQFTKRSYNLEDFLDHSYESMLDAELSKEIKKAPVVEYDIPRRIFTKPAADPVGENHSMVMRLWDFD